MENQVPQTTGDQGKEKKEKSLLRRLFIFALFVMLVLVIGYHFALPLLGVTVALTAGAWLLGVLTIVGLCLGVLLFFIIPAALVIVLAFIAFVWVVLVVSFFPILFPLLVPVLILVLVVAVITRRRNSRSKK